MRIVAHDTVLTARAIAGLRDQVLAFQARRAARDDGGTYWYPLAARPHLLFEHVIQRLRAFVPGDYAGAEWWVRAATPDANFPFHFDRDEALRDRIVSPDLASILYLGAAGGPTLVVDAAPTRRSPPRAAIAVHPSPGRFMMFPGALLHGVLPGRPSRWPRITMLVNWWRAEPRLERAEPRFARTAAASVAARTTVTPRRALEAIAPARIMSAPAWRDLISAQASYR